MSHRTYAQGALAIFPLLLAVIAISPFEFDSRALDYISGFGIVAVMGTALVTYWRRPGFVLGFLIFGLLAQIGSLAGEAAGMSFAIPCGQGIRFGALLLIAATIFRELLHVKRVTMNTVLGA